jgi:hypothetical protein
MPVKTGRKLPEKTKTAAGVELNPGYCQELCSSFTLGNLSDSGKDRDPTRSFGLLCLWGRILYK